MQPLRRCTQHGRQLLQLAVDSDADGLKAPLGGVLLLPQRRRRHGGADHLHQLPRSLDGGLFPALHDVPGDGGGIAFLAVFKQDAPQLLITPAVDHVPCRQTRRAVHPHIQWGVVHIGKSTLCIVQLWGGDAQVKEHPVHGVDVQVVQHLRQTAEVAVDQRHPVGVLRQTDTGGLQRRPVPVQTDEPSPCRQAAEDLQ